MPRLLGPTQPEWEALYRQLGQIIAEEPHIPCGDKRASSEILRWLGRAGVLIAEVSGVVDHSRFDSLRVSMLGTTMTEAENQMRHIRSLLYGALEKAELNAPTAARGAFIPAGNAFDALTSVAGVLRECTGSVLIVDPYMDAVTLTDFLPMIHEGVSIRLFASSKQKNSGLIEAISRWKDQYDSGRPIELRLAIPRLLHDRMIMDDMKIWSISQSFNAIAQRSPAMLQ